MAQNKVHCIKNLGINADRQKRNVSEMCAEIERMSITYKADRHERIRKITGQKTCSSIYGRIQLYTRELYEEK